MAAAAQVMKKVGAPTHDVDDMCLVGEGWGCSTFFGHMFVQVPRAAGALGRALRGTKVASLADQQPREVVDDIFSCALKKQTGGQAPSSSTLSMQLHACI